jgi:hypothetical protein
MAQTFGARLRHQREQRQVTLTTISTATKIKVSLLEALENGDVSQWPRGLFGRSYLRDYARVIGLDPDAVVAEFLALYPAFAYVTPQQEEAEAAARLEASRPAAVKLKRFVSTALSAVPIRAVPPPPSPRMAAAPPRPQPQPPFVRTMDGPPMLTMVEPMAEAADSEVMTFADDSDIAEAVAPPVPPRSPRELSLVAIADVCSRMARAIDWSDLTSLLAEAANVIDAAGLIVWQWDPGVTALRPSLAYGYAQSVLARLPAVQKDAANAVAAAFRSGERCIVDAADGSTEAVVVPSMGVNGCVGVLAVELRPGAQQRESVCAFTTILAAQLAMLLPAAPEPATV